MENCKKLTITPINKNIKSKSNIDYNEQLERSKCKLGWCWDDSTFNKAKANEYFAFLFYGIKVVIHRITAVKSPLIRLESWTMEDHKHRNVLDLSHPLLTLSWEEWIRLNGPKGRMGTYTTGDLSTKRPMLYNVLKELEFQDIDLFIQTNTYTQQSS